MISNNKEKIAEAPFLYVLMRILDNENLFKIDANNRHYNEDDPQTPYRKTVCNFEKPQLLKWAFTDTNLAQLKDEGQISLENELTKKQVAVQKDGLVVINRQEYTALDQASKTALFLHESILRTVILMNPKNISEHGTFDVRVMTRRMFRYFSERTYPAYSVLEAYEQLGIPSTLECRQLRSAEPNL